MLVLFILYLILIGIGYVIYTIIKPTNFPPGPKWYPLVGCSNAVYNAAKIHGSQFKGLLELSKAYSTEVLGLKLGSELVVVVYGEKNVRQVFTEKAFEGRPNSFFLRLRCLGKRMGITFTDGPLWKVHRQFTLTQLRNVGFGKTPMEKEIQNELHEILGFLNSNCYKSISPNNFVSQAVMNVLWRFVAGEKIKEKKWKHMQELFSMRSKAFSVAGGLLNQIPWCRFFIPNLSGYTLITKLNRQISDIIEILGIGLNKAAFTRSESKRTRLGPKGLGGRWKGGDRVQYLPVASKAEAIYKHNNNEIDGNDFIYSFLQQMDLNKETFTEDQLKMVCLDLLIAGAQTTGNLLEFALIQLLRNRQIQDKILDEIENVLGGNIPSWSDQSKLIYSSAFLLEVQRHHPIAPLAGPRRVLEDTVIDGFLIPKDTTVLISVGDIHFDPKLWDDPFAFKPERFIDEHGMLKNSEHMYPFGLGRRRCPGDSLAKTFIFITFVGILQHFRLECSNGAVPSNEPVIGLIASPKPFKADFVPIIRKKVL